MDTKILTTIIALLLVTLIVTQLRSTDQFPFSFNTAEQPSPGDWITRDQIKVHSEDVTLDISDAVFTTYANTNSMDPVLDEDTHGIEIKPREQDLNVGDIISYYSPQHDTTIVHRIKAISQDEQGTYYTLKGDNNPAEDQEKVRFDQIRGVVVALVY
jgi:hypothetical protein